MAPTLGKRKRVTRAELERPSRSASPSSSASDDDSGAEDLQAIFRRAFEAKFAPLPVEAKKPQTEESPAQEQDEGSEDEESDWSGISDDEKNGVQVISYEDAHHDLSDTERAEKKAFMSSKPPTSTSTSKPTSSKKKKTDDDDGTEASLLKNDLALQKLLRESHILSSSASNPTRSLTATGAARHKSTDLHLQSLGAKGSVFTQKNMPMAQRKHIVQKARLGEEKRRSEAREAGIVLERENRIGSGAGKKGGERRERGVGGPSVGKFRGGTLSLSREDVRSITGGRGGKKGGKGGRGRGGKR
ncbi:hypothetical protein CFE70_001503 [Pyrenophora teres f. teres 0-1]|uniref:Uncharacterized protein n=2 Tax=Pyrenophora teres f. teres TaxID=97479 RepID=E3S7Z8_PYRTT|nr:hypothetical protein PTT_19010 [Pyrenophora teres f. teres 0-1]KAE8842054.1 hypothetical protein HRS9139_01351 [Pyrenophora teres f. teres]KAE8850878.1 hypothetical protein PTNB85_01294 [Pyrenophora teres f. teres]KAE8869763.1 hypothetical protein PTNB29_00107 [Pyrenophora teres f. teres]KAE8873475.1 hypothetical protein PTNB73_00107 [Pyrenophora teres f. teres]